MVQHVCYRSRSSSPFSRTASYLCERVRIIKSGLLFRSGTSKYRAYISPIAALHRIAASSGASRNEIFPFKMLPARRRRRWIPVYTAARPITKESTTNNWISPAEQRRIPEGEVHGRIQKFDCRMKEQRREGRRTILRFSRDALCPATFFAIPRRRSMQFSYNAKCGTRDVVARAKATWRDFTGNGP